MIRFSENFYLKLLMIFKERCLCKSSTRKPVFNEKNQQIKYYIMSDLFPWDFYSMIIHKAVIETISIDFSNTAQ